MTDTFITAIIEGLRSIQRSDSIFYVPYFVVSYLIFIVVLIYRRPDNEKTILSTLFPRSIFLTKGCLTDFVVSFLYMVFFNVPTVLLNVWIGSKVYWNLLNGPFASYPFPIALQFPHGIEGVIVAAVTVVAFDFATYAVHRLMHAVPFLWEIHVVHHSPKVLNNFSAFRQHPLDRVLRNGSAAVLTGLCTAILHWMMPSKTPELAVQGIGIGSFLFLLTVHLQHTHIPIHYPKWISGVALSPHLHMLHHSSDERHLDKNFAGIFSFWDRWFGTLHDERIGIGQLKFGIKGEDPIQDSILNCYLHPFLAWFSSLRLTLSRSK